MGVKSVRNMNLVGTILFALFGTLLITQNYYTALIFYRDFPRYSMSSLCVTCLIIWFLIIMIFSVLLYKYAVLGLDRGNYKSAKQWTLIGIIVGVFGGIIPFIIFIISYVSFDDAIRDEQKYQELSRKYQLLGPFKKCDSCQKQIPSDGKFCTYCGVQQSPLDSSDKSISQPPKSKKIIPVKEQHEKPPPPPPPK